MENGKWKLAGYVHIPFFSFFYFKSTFLWHTKSRRRFKMDEKNVIDDDDDDTTRYSGAVAPSRAELSQGLVRSNTPRQALPAFCRRVPLWLPTPPNF